MPERLELRSERLRLLCLARPELGLLLHQPARLEQSLGVAISQPLLTETIRRAIGRKIARMQSIAESEGAWYTYWLAVITAERFGAGLLGFKGVPDRQGEVEISYAIDPRCAGQGYTTEAAAALIAWAFSHVHCRSIVAPGTRRDNPASNRILEKLGMRVYDETPSTRSWRLDRQA